MPDERAANAAFPDCIGLTQMAKSSKTILCIDDDPTAVEMRRLILLSKGYEVLIATQGDADECLVRETQRVCSGCVQL
jgi:response regulator RpfG family c-di-GMP phosphodiesterase